MAEEGLLSIPVIIPSLPSHGSITSMCEYAQWAARHDFMGFRARYIGAGPYYVDGRRLHDNTHPTDNEWASLGMYTIRWGHFSHEINGEWIRLMKSAGYTGFPPIPDHIPPFPPGGFGTAKAYARWASSNNFRGFRDRYQRRANYAGCNMQSTIHSIHCVHHADEWANLAERLVVSDIHTASARFAKASVLIEWRQIDPAIAPPKPAKIKEKE